MAKNPKAIREALGASRSTRVPETIGTGPLGLLALRDAIATRLRSSGGRPTDPSWTISRQVPFRPECWVDLQRIADELGKHGRKVGPAQVAAILIENALAKLSDDTSLAPASRSGERRPGA